MRHSSFYLCVLLGGVLLGLSGCGWTLPQRPWMDKDPLSFITSGPKDRVPDISAEEAKAMDMAAEGKSTQTESLVQHPADSSKPHSGFLSVNLEEYFQGAMGTEDRLTRLETAVKEIHKTIKAQHTGHGAAQALESMQVKPMLSPGDMAVPEAAKEPIVLDAVARGPRAVNVTQTTVTGIRVGKHPGYVRIVFDVTGKTPFNVDLDNGEKILVVELNGTTWQPPVMSESFGKMSLLRSYKVDPMGGGAGHIFVMQLKHATSVMQKKMYDALSGGGKRIVIDLKL